MLIQVGVSQLVTGQTQAPATRLAEETETATATAPVSPDSESVPLGKSDVPGVLRHLQAGKFKGVADVRLRIVFHDQLTALAEQQAKARTEEAAQTMVSGIASEVGGFAFSVNPAVPEASTDELAAVETVESGPAELEDAVTEFGDAVTAATNVLVQGKGTDLQTYESGLRAAFESLVRNLESTLMPAAGVMEQTTAIIEAENAGVEPEVTALAEEVGETDAKAVAVAAFLEELSHLFSRELATLLDSAAGGEMLPPLSEPAGNGRAYDKFRAIYDELSRADTAPSDSTNVDVES